MTDEVSLRDYVETQFAAERRVQQTREDGDRRALQLALETQTLKDLALTELRDRIAQNTNVYATKDELAAAVDRLRDLQGQTQRVLLSILVALIVAITAGIAIAILQTA